MTERRKAAIQALLKSIETGDPKGIAVVDEARYIQHNPQTHEGSEGLSALFQRLAKMSPRVNLVRVFSDGDFVFGHTEYDFSTRRIGFEVFRFEGDHAVEHWDNIQPRRGPNSSGHSMVDGPSEATDLDQTEANRARARTFVTQVLIEGALDRLGDFVDSARFVEHNPSMADDLIALREGLLAPPSAPGSISYERVHRVLAEGCFTLCVSEGRLGGEHTAFYDLFRFEAGKIVEHWDTVEHVAPREQWKNNNGKF